MAKGCEARRRESQISLSPALGQEGRREGPKLRAEMAHRENTKSVHLGGSFHSRLSECLCHAFSGQKCPLPNQGKMMNAG